LLEAGLLRAYIAGEIKSQDDLVAHLCAKTNVRKHVARLLVFQAISRHAKLKRFQAKSEHSPSEKRMLLKGRSAGYI
jgi:hypothetical protein